MTLWQLLLLIAGEFALIAAANRLRALRLATSAVAPTSRFSGLFELLMGIFFACLAFGSWWTDGANAEHARQQGYTWHVLILPTVMVNIAFLLLAIAFLYFLTQAILYVRHLRRGTDTVVANP